MQLHFRIFKKKLDLLGQNCHASLIFDRRGSLENCEAFIILRDTKTNTIFYNPGGTNRIHDKHEQKKLLPI
jgi:hypothetical protein